MSVLGNMLKCSVPVGLIDGNISIRTHAGNTVLTCSCGPRLGCGGLSHPPPCLVLYQRPSSSRAALLLAHFLAHLLRKAVEDDPSSWTLCTCVKDLGAGCGSWCQPGFSPEWWVNQWTGYLFPTLSLSLWLHLPNKSIKKNSSNMIALTKSL